MLADGIKDLVFEKVMCLFVCVCYIWNSFAFTADNNGSLAFIDYITGQNV